MIAARLRVQGLGVGISGVGAAGTHFLSAIVAAIL